MAVKRLHQVVNTMLKGDATSDHVLLIQRWLRDLGFESQIFALEWEKGFEHEVHRYDGARLRNDAAVVFHHNMGSAALADLALRKIPLVLIYHNITPPQFFGDIDFGLTQQLNLGRRQLEEVRPVTGLALSDSPYSELELKQLGFSKTGVLPIVLDETQYRQPLKQPLYDEMRGGGPVLLFVGRLSPNKRQEDVIKLLYYYRRIEPAARLVLVGGAQSPEYVSWLEDLVEQNDLGQAVTFAGRVSQQEMVTYFKAADVFVSMSEHEGFGKPLIESMYLELPILAYDSTAVPYTLGGASVLFKDKSFEALAEMVDMLVRDRPLRDRLIARQSERVQAFLEPAVRRQWIGYLDEMGLLIHHSESP